LADGGGGGKCDGFFGINLRNSYDWEAQRVQLNFCFAAFAAYGSVLPHTGLLETSLDRFSQAVAISVGSSFSRVGCVMSVQATLFLPWSDVSTAGFPTCDTEAAAPPRDIACVLKRSFKVFVSVMSEHWR
jgi:hypothetical protein